MAVPLNLKEQKKYFTKTIKTQLKRIKDSIPSEIKNLKEGVDALQQLRINEYENINQYQHAALILEAAEWLEKNLSHYRNIDWFWNPHQTGGAQEPDLLGICNGQSVIAAEITTSENPVGTISIHMQKTIKKLSNQDAIHKYYFIRTNTMFCRACSKAKNQGLKISIVNLLNDERQIFLIET